MRVDPRALFVQMLGGDGDRGEARTGLIGHLGAYAIRRKKSERCCGAEARSAWKGSKHRPTPRQRSHYRCPRATQSACTAPATNGNQKALCGAGSPEGESPQRKSDRRGLRRRAPRQIFANGRSSWQQDLLRERNGANYELRLSDDLGLGRGAGAATEVRAQIAMPVFLCGLAQRVRRINGGTRDQSAGRRYGDQMAEIAAHGSIVFLTSAQISRPPPGAQHSRGFRRAVT